jgi:hypothetical protein
MPGRLPSTVIRVRSQCRRRRRHHRLWLLLLLRLLIRNWLVDCCSRALPACTRQALRVLRWVPLMLHRLHRLPLCQLAELLVSRSPRPRAARCLSLGLPARLNLRLRGRLANLGGRSLSTSVEGLQLADGLHRRLSSGTYEVLVPSKYPRMARCETEANWIPPNPPTTASWIKFPLRLPLLRCFASSCGGEVSQRVGCCFHRPTRMFFMRSLRF